jgi:hypothetical protein
MTAAGPTFKALSRHKRPSLRAAPHLFHVACDAALNGGCQVPPLAPAMGSRQQREAIMTTKTLAADLDMFTGSATFSRNAIQPQGGLHRGRGSCDGSRQRVLAVRRERAIQPFDPFVRPRSAMSGPSVRPSRIASLTCEDGDDYCSSRRRLNGEIEWKCLL